MVSSSSTRVTFKPQELPFIRERSLGRSWFWIRSAEAREREKKTENTQYSLGVSKLHLPLHIDLINS